MSEEIPPNTITHDILCSTFYSNSKKLLLKKALFMAKQLLKDTVVKNIKPGVKDIRLSDGNCLYLLVKPEGA